MTEQVNTKTIVTMFSFLTSLNHKTDQVFVNHYNFSRMSILYVIIYLKCIILSLFFGGLYLVMEILTD